MMEKIYEQFVANVLPKIAEGVVITRDYFFELFGRYIKYLIVIDSIFLIASIISILLAIIIYKKYFKYKKDWEKDEKEGNFFNDYDATNWFITAFSVIAVLVCSISGIIGVVNNSKNLAKDIFIPEIKVYQELQQYIK